MAVPVASAGLGKDLSLSFHQNTDALSRSANSQTVVGPAVLAVGGASVARAGSKRKLEVVLPKAGAADEPVCVNTLIVRPGVPNVRGAQLGTCAGDGEGAPWSVLATGFQAAQLNTRFDVWPEVMLGGQRTYWSESAKQNGCRYFLLWQKALAKWVICAWLGDSSDSALASSLVSESAPSSGRKAGRVPDVTELEMCEWCAFQLDVGSVPSHHRSSRIGRLLADGCCWMERDFCDTGSWCRVKAQISVGPSLSSLASHLFGDDSLQIEAVDIEGFHRVELNARYSIWPEVVLNGKPSFWDATGRLFLYWQLALKRWAICGRRHLEMVKGGQCLGCACQLDQVHFSMPARWVEYSDGSWIASPVEVFVWQQEDGECHDFDGKHLG